jgi:hypothetical protein
MQVENEELVFTLEVLVDKFGDEIAPFAVNLARNLTAAFWKYSGMADGEDGEEEDDQGEPRLQTFASGHRSLKCVQSGCVCDLPTGSGVASWQSSVQVFRFAFGPAWWWWLHAGALSG